MDHPKSPNLPAMPVAETDIQVGDTVKSYDFPSRYFYRPADMELDYVAGEVVAIVDHPEGYKAYEIHVSHRVANGKPHPPRTPGEIVRCPVNGTPTYGECDYTFGVRRIID